MNKRLIFFVSLATLTLSYSPAALANAPTWSASTPVNPAPANAPPSHSTLQPAQSSLPTPANAQRSDQRLTAPFWADSVPSPTEDHSSDFQAPAVEGYLPIAPAAPTSSTAPFAIPIPSDLGLQFGLSEAGSDQAPAVQPSQPSQLPQLPQPASTPSPAPMKPFSEPLPVPPKKAPAAAPLAPLPAPSTPPIPSQQAADFTLGDLFAGGSESLVAIVVGSAEGTRSPDGKPNENFYGHSDPGNGVWNLGTFSYQHGAASPEEADVKQLKRLKQQAQVMQDKAASSGLKLTLEETLNGIDLANQAPKAVIDGEGYVEWLMKAHQIGKTGSDAILWARVQSFIDPKTQRWNAPGLGNTADSITHDQQRRISAIARAIEAQNYQIASDARLRPQPIGFRLPRWNLGERMIHTVTTLLSRN